MASNVKWIKMMVGMFDGMSFKKIKRAKIGGESFRDKLTAVWFELMDFAGKCNHEGAFISPSEIPFTDLSDIATMIDRDEEELKLCMSFFINEGMVTVIDDVYSLSNWSEYQNQEGLDRIREQTRKRVAKHREAQKLLSGNVTCNVTVTESNATEIDIDKEKEEDKEIYIKVIQHLNEKAGTRYKPSSSKTKTCIHARLAEGFTLDDFYMVIDKKCAEWIGTEWEKFLRPETLFGTKFEGYLNSKGRVNGNGRDQQSSSENPDYGTYL